MRKSKTVLGDICKITMGQSPDSSTYHTTNIGLPFYQGNADFGELYPKTRIWCSRPQKIAEPENILLSVRAPIGALNIAKEKCCIGRGLAAIAPHKNFCFNKYLFYILKYKHNELNAKGSGSTFKAINKSILNDLPIDIYPIDRQKKIAAILDKATELIALRKQQLEKLDLMVKSRFIEMFGNSVINKWKKITIEECCSKIVDCPHSTPLYCNDGYYPCIRTSDLVNGYLTLSSSTKYVNNIEYIKRIQRYKPTFGDIIYSREGERFGIAAIIPKELFVCLGQRIMLFSPQKSIVTSEYLCGVLNSNIVYEQAKNSVGGATSPHVNMKDIKLFTVPYPPLSLQKEFTTFIKQVDKTKSTLQQSLEKLELNYKALMQTYFG
jgi:type I restriction enzyme S subunit